MEAKYLLALLLVKGQGVAADPERAKTLLEQTKDTRPESLYYLTYLESDPEKKEAYARAYLAGNPEKTRKAQVEKLLGIVEPETAEEPETAKKDREEDGQSNGRQCAKAEPASKRDASAAPVPQSEKTARPTAVQPQTETEERLPVKEDPTEAVVLRRRGIARIQAGDERGTDDLQKAADMGDVDACLLLGEAALLLVKGQGVAADPERAKTLLEQTKDTRPESLYYLTYLESDPEKKEAYARAYLEGNPEKTRKAQVEKLLGIEEPETVKEEPEEPAADEDNPGAIQTAQPEPVEESQPAQAADGGEPGSQPVVHEDPTEAVVLRRRGIARIQAGDERGTDDLQKAADMGDVDACLLLGEAMEDPTEAVVLRRRGIARIQAGDERGTDDLQKAADMGDVDACLLLGEAMLETDPAQGVKYLETAAKAGIGDGYALLGYAYMNGLGVPADQRRAHILIHEALKRGSRIARQWLLSE